MDDRIRYLQQRRKRLAGPSGYAGVTRDAASLKYFPASSAEWTAFISQSGVSGIAVPSSLHGCQDASGSITDQIGSLTMTKFGGGVVNYQASETGYTRKAIAAAGSTQYFQTTDASLPDPTTSSILSLAIFRGSATSEAGILVETLPTPFKIYAEAAGKLGAYTSAGTATGSNVINGEVRPLSVRYNRTATTITAFSDRDKISPAWAASTGKLIQAFVNQPGALLYMAHWYGVNAEISDANWKALLQALGWTITWA